MTDAEVTQSQSQSPSRLVDARWREPGAVLLVSCYELGHQPIGLASPLAFLERAGFQPDANDLALSRLDEEKVRRARFVGLSVPMHTAMRIALKAAARVRGLNPSAHICFYGLYAPLLRTLLEARGEDGRAIADSIVGGEYEAELVAQVESLAQGEARDRVPPSPLVRLSFPAPARERLLSLSKYAQVIYSDGKRGVAGYTEASRGCLHRCNHCPIPAVYGGRFFVVPVDVVLADVAQQVAAGARHVTLGDPDFLNGPGHAMAVARAIHAAFPSLTFDVTAKIEHILRRRALWPELASLGCLFVTTAVESLSERVLAILEKGHTRAEVTDAIAVVRSAGITVRPTWVPFTPWSTLAEHLALFEFLDAQHLFSSVDPVQLTIRLLLPPGSLLLSHDAMQPHLRGFDPASLSYRWAHPDPRMDALQRASSALVARDEEEGVAARVTWESLRSLSHAREKAPPAVHFPTEGAPRLSENWFC